MGVDDVSTRESERLRYDASANFKIILREQHNAEHRPCRTVDRTVGTSKPRKMSIRWVDDSINFHPGYISSD